MIISTIIIHKELAVKLLAPQFICSSNRFVSVIQLMMLDGRWWWSLIVYEIQKNTQISRSIDGTPINQIYGHIFLFPKKNLLFFLNSMPPHYLYSSTMKPFLTRLTMNIDSINWFLFFVMPTIRRYVALLLVICDNNRHYIKKAHSFTLIGCIINIMIALCFVHHTGGSWVWTKTITTHFLAFYFFHSNIFCIIWCHLFMCVDCELYLTILIE